MSPDLLVGIFQSLLDPTAPLPIGFPGGALGAFLLFLLPIGGGMPVGVLVARDGGVAAGMTVLLYLLSDVIGALVAEPLLIGARRLGSRSERLRSLGTQFAQLTGQAGLRDEGARGPLGLVLLSFAISPTAGRAASAAAGHGFLTGWALAITGDLIYFTMVMGSTLWLSDQLGDSRTAVAVVLVLGWLMPVLLRKWRSSQLVRAEVGVPALD
jgi:hypothetical protein